jgi:RES domain-containing protein
VLTAWRIAKTRYADAAFEGEGARVYGGRWNSVGVRVAYASESVALAVLEVLVGIEKTSLLASYSLVSARFSAAAVEVLAAGELPDNWRSYPPPPDTQRIGDRWIAECRSLVLQVPSAIIEAESNFLLNPAHPAFASIERSAPMAFDIAPRLVAAVRKR